MLVSFLKFVCDCKSSKVLRVLINVKFWCQDIAWLPAWLQPHQRPAFGDDATDEHDSSQLSCKV